MIELLGNKKISEKKNNKALKQAIERKVKCMESFQIKDNILYIVLSGQKVYDNGAKLILPSYKDIEDSARYIYINFKIDDISKVCYLFKDLTISKKIEIEPNFCDVEFYKCVLYDLHVFGGDSIRIIDTDFMSGSIISVNCQELELKNVESYEASDRVNVISNEVNIDSSILKTVGNIDITSPIMVFNNTKLEGQNINLNCDLIDTKNTVLKSEFDFNINCRYNETVKYVETKSIRYNRKDITNSDQILKFKLLRNLVEYLKKVKDMVTYDIEKDIEETTRIRRETLEEKPITKILNKNNR